LRDLPEADEGRFPEARLELRLPLKGVEEPLRLDVLIPPLLRLDVLPREVRVPVSPARPSCLDDRFERELLLRVDADREELRTAPSPLRAVVLAPEDLPSARLGFRPRCALVDREFPRDPAVVIRERAPRPLVR
jgi:hypothetical protein